MLVLNLQNTYYLLQNLSKTHREDPCQDDDIIFEDFVRARSKGGETEA